MLNFTQQSERNSRPDLHLWMKIINTPCMWAMLAFKKLKTILISLIQRDVFKFCVFQRNFYIYNITSTLSVRNFVLVSQFYTFSTVKKFAIIHKHCYIAFFGMIQRFIASKCLWRTNDAPITYYLFLFI